MKFFRMAVMAFPLLMGGCASNPMLEAEFQAITPIQSEQSQIVFMRSSFVGSAINASLYDVTDSEPEFIGIIANGTKIAHITAPGKHTFMVVSEAADFMAADLLPGKTYYSLVTPRVGAWKARFSLWPISTDDEAEYSIHSGDFEEWLDDTDLMVNTDASRQWFRNNLNSIKAKQTEYWPVWQQKSAEDKARRTLKPQDGM